MVRRSSDRPPRTISEIIEIAKKSRRLNLALEISQLVMIMLGLGIVIGLVGLAHKLVGGR